MQLTDALDLVPPRQRKDEAKEPVSNARLALLPVEDLQNFLLAPQQDVPMVFGLAGMVDYFSRKGKGTEEAKYALQGVIEELMFDEAMDAEEKKVEETYSLFKRFISWSVTKVFRFAAKLLWRGIWGLVKWVLKEVVIGGVRLMLNWLIRPVLMEMLGFLAINPELWPIAAVVGGAIGIGALIYNKFFDKPTPSGDAQPDLMDDATERLLGEGEATDIAAGGAPISVGPSNLPPATNLAALLTRGESRGANPYNVVNIPNANNGRGAAGTRPLETMTVSQVMAAQRAGEFNASGRYQIIDSTLSGAFRALRLTGNELYDRNLQDKIFNEYLTGPAKRPRLYAYLSGKSNDVMGAAYDASQEWASVASPQGYPLRSGRGGDGVTSYYDNSRNNHASISAAEMIATLQLERQRRSSANVTESDAPQVIVKPGSSVPATAQQQQQQAATQNAQVGMPPVQPTRSILRDRQGNMVSAAL